jgi:hypothetical protein
LVRDVYRENEGDRERLKQSLTAQLQLIDDRLTRLTDLLIDTAIDRATYNARREQYLMERQGLVEQLAIADQRSPVEAMFEEFERHNREFLRYETLLDDEKRELLDIVCSNFSVRGESSTFTMRTPYREIAESDDPQRCAHGRDDVRLKRIVETLKNILEQ